MKRITTAWLAASTLAFAGLTFDVPMYDNTSPHLRHLRHAKPVTHDPRGSRSKAERNARKATRRARVKR